MLTYERLRQRPKHFLSFVGLSVEQFDSYYMEVEKAYASYNRKRLDRIDRKRAIGAGGKFKLSLKDRMVMSLMWIRLYVSYSILGYMFDLDESNVYRNIKMLLPLLRDHLPLPERLRPDLGKIESIGELQRYYPELLSIVDATEQPVRRPKGWDRQKPYYSGKRKRHSLKVQLTVNSKGMIMDMSSHCGGRRHDYQLFKDSGVDSRLPPGISLYMDKAYQGVKRDYPGRTVYIPKRSSKSRPLTDRERALNRAISSIRIEIEHVISRMRKYRIFSDCYRNAKSMYDKVALLVAGLVNLRTLWRLGLNWTS